MRSKKLSLPAPDTSDPSRLPIARSGPGPAPGSATSSNLKLAGLDAPLPNQASITPNARTQVPGVVNSVKVSVTGPHKSVAVGTVNTGAAGHSIMVGPGSAEIVGFVVSTTVIVWPAVAVFPHVSVAVQVRLTL